MSSDGGDCRPGNLAFSRSTVSSVSSTDSVVWDLARIAHLDLVDRVGTVDQGDVLGRLAAGPDDLLVPLVPDEQNVVLVPRVPSGLLVHLGDQRAGRVDRVQVALAGLLVHLRGDPVRGEDHRGTLRYLVVLLDEDRALALQRLHHVLVVHDLFPHVDGCAVEFERALDGLHGSVDAGAVSARPGQQHPLRHDPHGRPVPRYRRPR
jgi:hypothetical protein